MRNVKSLQESLKKMDAAYDVCHEVMSFGELHNFKGELLAQSVASVDSKILQKVRIHIDINKI
jgi:hypothetical protein